VVAAVEIESPVPELRLPSRSEPAPAWRGHVGFLSSPQRRRRRHRRRLRRSTAAAECTEESCRRGRDYWQSRSSTQYPSLVLDPSRDLSLKLDTPDVGQVTPDRAAPWRSPDGAVAGGGSPGRTDRLDPQRTAQSATGISTTHTATPMPRHRIALSDRPAKCSPQSRSQSVHSRTVGQRHRRGARVYPLAVYEAATPCGQNHAESGMPSAKEASQRTYGSSAKLGPQRPVACVHARPRLTCAIASSHSGPRVDQQGRSRSRSRARTAPVISSRVAGTRRQRRLQHTAQFGYAATSEQRPCHKLGAGTTGGTRGHWHAIDV